MSQTTNTAPTLLERFQSWVVQDGNSLSAADLRNMQMCLEAAKSVFRAAGVQERTADEIYTLTLFQLGEFYWDVRGAENGKYPPPPPHIQGLIDAMRYGGE